MKQIAVILAVLFSYASAQAGTDCVVAFEDKNHDVLASVIQKDVTWHKEQNFELWTGYTGRYIMTSVDTSPDTSVEFVKILDLDEEAACREEFLFKKSEQDQEIYAGVRTTCKLDVVRTLMVSCWF